MSRPKAWRDEFIAAASREGMHIDTVRAFLRISATLTRLAEAQCNGNWPCDNGERPTVACADCQSGYVRSAIRKDGRCVDCHASDKARALAPEGWTVTLSGDPRGCCVTLKAPSGRVIGVP